MSDGNGKSVEPEFVASATLTIQLDLRTGSVRVAGPLDNALMTLGMLELAKDAVAEARKRKQNKNLVTIPQVPILPGLLGRS